MRTHGVAVADAPSEEVFKCSASALVTELKLEKCWARFYDEPKLLMQMAAPASPAQAASVTAWTGSSTAMCLCSTASIPTQPASKVCFAVDSRWA